MVEKEHLVAVFDLPLLIAILWWRSIQDGGPEGWTATTSFVTPSPGPMSGLRVPGGALAAALAAASRSNLLLGAAALVLGCVGMGDDDDAAPAWPGCAALSWPSIQILASAVLLRRLVQQLVTSSGPTVGKQQHEPQDKYSFYYQMQKERLLRGRRRALLGRTWLSKIEVFWQLIGAYAPPLPRG